MPLSKGSHEEKLAAVYPGGVLLGIFGGGVPPASPNPDPISNQKMPFPTPVIRPGFKNPYPFSDLILYVIKHNRQNLAGMIYLIYFRFSLTSYSPWLLGRKISL